MTALTGAELVAELRRIAELVPTSDAGVAMLAAAQQLELVREWAERNADRDPGDGGRDTEFGQGYRRGAEWARWLLGGPQPVILHEGSDWPGPVEWRSRSPHDVPVWMAQGDVMNGRHVQLHGDADSTVIPEVPRIPVRKPDGTYKTLDELRAEAAVINARGWADPASTPLADVQEWNRRTEEEG